MALVTLFGSHVFAGIQLSVNIAPPPITVFDQPPCPGDGYIWTPGYYQYGDYGYYWVQGTWVLPPGDGLLWTPGYWALDRRNYVWHQGYWGSQVAFYGGINYGNGYFGTGFNGGRWEGSAFKHNTVVSRVDPNNVRNTYEDRSVLREIRGPNHAFNGKGGVRTQPSRGEVEASRAPHQGPMPVQISHAEEAHNHHLAAHGAERK